MPIATSGRHGVRGPWISRISNRYTLVPTQKDEEISITIHDIVEAYNLLYLCLSLHAPQDIDVASAALAYLETHAEIVVACLRRDISRRKIFRPERKA